MQENPHSHLVFLRPSKAVFLPGFNFFMPKPELISNYNFEQQEHPAYYLVALSIM